jgi:hypothetical protein
MLERTGPGALDEIQAKPDQAGLRRLSMDTQGWDKLFQIRAGINDL